MNIEVGEWQTRLSKHFAELCLRRCKVAERPVFALEHGLDSTEVESLSNAVRTYIAKNSPSLDHALVWIVYATEIGYRYSGDEYWQTFEQETPGWTIRGDRYWIRECFQSFQREFGGAQPSGIWAQHFSIICWPITHAILPLDLQRQLARILYELRHSFSAEVFESPATLGEFVGNLAWNATSRFRNFAQETQLVGQIAAALLLQEESGSGNLVYPATLRRIRNDLDRERLAREWLRGARRVAKERARVRGLAPVRGIIGARRPEEARAEAVALGIEPRLVLRPTTASGTLWDVSLEIPDLSHLLFRFPQTRDILTGCRCIVAGSSGRPLARGRCLHGTQRVVLSRWPRNDEVLLQFEQSEPQLEYLLRTECLLRPGPTWLFRIASDGFAYELRSLRVRPSERYIIVNSNVPIQKNNHVNPIDLECEGVNGAMLEVPSALTEAWEQTLRDLGLGQAKTIEVWPAGLAAVVWDGEGHGEWVASERPCLAVRTDHPVAALVLSMGTNTELSLEMTSVVPGEPVFIELPQLPVGLHTVRLCTRSSVDAGREPLGELDVVMRIREARSWSPGISTHGPLLVQMDPSTPTLEELWEGRVEIRLLGPTGRHIACVVSLFEKGKDVATVTQRLPGLALPISSEHWRAYFNKHFREREKVQIAYDSARTCEIEFNADELGAFTIRCEREFSPLRWVVRHDGDGNVIRLLNDTGDTNLPVITRMAFESPVVEERLDFTCEYHTPSSGGMHVATLGKFRTASIVPAVVRGLDDLCCVPHIDSMERSLGAVQRLLGIARLWSEARLPGDLISAKRQRDVLQALTQQICRLICGENWAREELNACKRGDVLTSLKYAVSRRREEVAVGVVLARDCAELAKVTCEERVERLTSLAVRFLLLPVVETIENVPAMDLSEDKRDSPNDSRWLSELALRIASCPMGIETWAGDYLRDGLGRLLEVPTLTRAARLLVIAIDREFQSNVSSSELYAGWRWS